MDPTLSALLQELKTSSSLTIQGARLPEEKIVVEIGRMKNQEALPYLEDALNQAIRFKEVCVNMQSMVNTGAVGSASPFIAAMLAEQTISAIRNAISNCGIGF